MKIRIWQAYVLAIFLAAPVALAQVQLVVKTDAGLVAGTGSDIHVWKGIPYAQPPVGDLRWQEPQPAAAWPGIRHALEFGPMCPQGNPANLKPDMSEDCLTLNVWSEHSRAKSGACCSGSTAADSGAGQAASTASHWHVWASLLYPLTTGWECWASWLIRT